MVHNINTKWNNVAIIIMHEKKNSKRIKEKCKTWFKAICTFPPEQSKNEKQNKAK